APPPTPDIGSRGALRSESGQLRTYAARIRDYGRGEAIMSTVLEPVRSPAAECGVLLLPRRPWEPCFPWADGPETPVYRGGLQRRAPQYPCKSAHRADPYIRARCEAVHTFSNDAGLGSARIKVG